MFGFSFVRNKTIDQMKETLTLFQRQLEDIGWINMSTDPSASQEELFGDTFEKMLKTVRLFYYKSPLAGLWVNLTTAFVFGEGLSTPKCKDAKIQDVINDFWDDRDNQKAFTSFAAQQMLCNKIQVEGNLFFVLFDDDAGNVRVRLLNSTEVSDIIFDENDRMRPLFYKVKVMDRKYNYSSGSYQGGGNKFMFYPDVELPDPEAFGVPKDKLVIEGKILHTKVNCDINDKFGVPDLYRGIDWMKAHKTMSEDVATLVKSLSTFAWKKKIKGSASQVATIASAMNSKMNLSNIKNSAGQTQIENEGVDLQSVDIKTGGVNIGIDGMRQMKLMVCAAANIYEHYFGDPSTGNLATSKSMELPMIKKFLAYQSLFNSVYTGVLNYQIDRKIEAGLLPGKEEFNEKTNRKIFTTTADRTIDADFPPIIESDLKADAEAFVLARGRLIPRELASRLFMLSANVNNIDEEIEKMAQEEEPVDYPFGGGNGGGPFQRPGQGGRGNNGAPAVKEKDAKEIKEAIEAPEKRIKARAMKKENFVLQKMNGYRRVIAGHFKDMLDSVRDNMKITNTHGVWVGHVPEFYELLNKFTEGMREAAKSYFPLAVQIGEKYMQSMLKDVRPEIKIEETMYEAQGKANDVLRNRLLWNDTYLMENLEPAMIVAFEKAVRKAYNSEAEFREAINQALVGFESRIEQYVGGFWTVEEEAVKEAGRGTGVMVNFVGPDDQHTCEGCEHAVNGNPWLIDEAPLPGEQQCLGRCRHALQIVA
ncbi:MAG: portal protein [Siphoviridae sp. ctCJE6]|nr:MAG: portal protein [Siphoviridae sp. ctCJE6]